MQWLRALDSCLHSTLRTVPPTAPWTAACTALCTAPLPNLATALWAAACTAAPFPEFATALSRTAQHPAPSNPAQYPAPPRSDQQPAQHPAQHLCQTSPPLWTAACTAQHHARLRPQCSTFEKFCEQLPPAAASSLQLLHSLCQTSPACAARCAARFPDFATAANSSPSHNLYNTLDSTAPLPDFATAL